MDKKTCRKSKFEEEDDDESEDGTELVFGTKKVCLKKKKVVFGGGSGCGGALPPRCQADNCSADLADSKMYYRRHRVCELHAKAPTVILGGLRQRFCQQCSRFHDLSEFDDTKRSCRRRLAGHNERRRKISSESLGEESSAHQSSVGVVLLKKNHRDEKYVENPNLKQFHHNLH